MKHIHVITREIHRGFFNGVGNGDNQHIRKSIHFYCHHWFYFFSV